MRNFLLMISVFCLISSASAQDINKILKKVKGKYSSADYFTVFDSTFLNMKESGITFAKIHYLKKINSSKATVDLKNIILDYDPQSAAVEFTKVSIWKKDGTEKVINLKNVIDYPAYTHLIYWGARQKMIDLGKLEKGDAIEVKYKRKGFTYALLGDDNSKFIPPMRGHFYDIVNFFDKAPIYKKYYELKTPNTKNIKYKIFNTRKIKEEKKSKNSINIYTFSAKNILPIKKEYWMESILNVSPKLIITTAADWYQKAAWFNKVNKDYGSFDSFPSLDRKVKSIIKDAKTEFDTIRKLTHWVANNMRYCGVSMGKGEGFTLHNAKMNFRDRAGVCKDKASLLIAMLRSAGLESYPAMTMAGSRIEDIPADQFNHCVALVKSKDGYYKILDPTWVPFCRETWSSAEQQQNYLPGIPGGADLQITPISSPDNHFINLNVESSISKDGNLKASLKLEAEGQSDRSFRSPFTRTEKANWDYVSRSLISSNISGINVKSYKLNTNPYDVEKRMNIESEIEVNKYIIQNSTNIIVHPIVTQLFKTKYYHLRHQSSTKYKKYGFKDSCSRLINLHEEIKLPYDVEILDYPQIKEIKTDVASFSASYRIVNRKLIIDASIRFEKRVYKAKDWKDYRNVLEAHERIINAPIILKIK
ncbi:DUF3857 domain-containing protein [Marinilabiliaceae bacterium JC040]|nr:DUF3857 domain-containing protein [Marinilabiliaceae bacterium JC040]